MSYRELLSIIAIALTFVGFLPYIRSILRGSTRPHLFSWLIWGTSTCVVFGAQLSAGGGAGSWPIGLSGMVTLYIALLAWHYRADTKITASDWVFLVAALSSLPLWYLTADPLWAVLLLTLIDTLGFAPTLRKAHARPHEENLLFFAIFLLRNLIAIGALERYSVTTVLFPAVTAAACLLLILVVTYRRRLLVAELTEG